MENKPLEVSKPRRRSGTPKKPNAKLSARNPPGKLTPEQAETVERWLSTNNYSYNEVIRRCAQEFKITDGNKSVFSLYHKIQQRRNLDRVMRDARAASETARTGADGILRICPKTPDEIYERLLKIVGEMAFEMATNKADAPDHATIRDYIKLLSAARRELLQDKRIGLDREKWEFDVSEACFKHLPELKAIQKNDTIPYKEKIRLIRMKLFGCAPERLPDDEAEPEENNLEPPASNAEC